MYDAKEKKDRKRRRGPLSGGNLSRREDKLALLLDIGTLVLGLLFSCTHVAFGAYPLGIGLISVLPSRVWYAVLGSALGALTLGKSGLVYGMIYIILAFLRLIVSGNHDSDESTNSTPLDGLGLLRGGNGFREGLMLRISVSVIGGFIAGVYELLLGGFTEQTLAFALSMILLPPLSVLSLYGLFAQGTKPTHVLGLKESAVSEEVTGLRATACRCSALALTFFISLSLAPYSFLGISIAYVFAGAAAILAAYRSGALAGAAVGFAAALGQSGVYAAAFALCGLACGALFRLGSVYGLVGGGVAVALFSAYTGGLEGFLTVFPEYAISAAIAAPATRKIPSARRDELTTKPKEPEPSRVCRDMVGTVSLSYRNKYKGSLNALESALSNASDSIRKYGEGTATPTKNDYRDLVYDCIMNFFSKLRQDSDVNNSLQVPYVEDEELNRLAEALYTRGRLDREEVEAVESLRPYAEPLGEAIGRGVAILRRECYGARQTDATGEEMSIISRLIGEGRLRDECELSVNDERGKRLQEILREQGITDAVCLALGERECHLIISAPDPEGVRLCGRELLSAIEEGLNLRLSLPDYQQRDGVTVMECHALTRLACECATAGIPCKGQQVSGDKCLSFNGGDGKFHLVLADGMGSGPEARAGADLVTEFMKATLSVGAGTELILGLLNKILRRQRHERSVSLDLLTIDLYNGDGSFLKSGAASSYVKRGGSIYRIRSRTAPLGLLGGLDAEQIKSQISPECYVIMLSDGINVNTEDSGWFLEMLAKEPPTNLQEYADGLLKTCLEHIPPNDDCTIAVVKVINAT